MTWHASLYEANQSGDSVEAGLPLNISANAGHFVTNETGAQGNRSGVQIEQINQRLSDILMPYAKARRERLYPERSGYAKFVHYTTAEAALKIIETKRLWLRNTTCMGDYREVQHGFDTLDRVLRSTPMFAEALDACSPDLAKDAFAFFNQWWGDIQFNTYIASLSEHYEKENLHGRLSMWRAFGGTVARVAAVLNVPWFSGGAQALNLIFSPVAYFGEKQVGSELGTVVENIRANTSFLQSVGRTVLLGHVFNMLMAAVTCMKHEGFDEEREWRVIYGPKRLPSELIEKNTHVIAGVPQIIYKMPLDINVSPALAELDVSRIIDRIIIGPTQYPVAISGAFVEALTRCGVRDAGKRVYVSGIPIRA